MRGRCLEKHCLSAILQIFVEGELKKIKWEVKEIPVIFFKATIKNIHINGYAGHCTCIALCMVERFLRRIFKYPLIAKCFVLLLLT